MKDARGHGSNKTNGISVINPNGGNIARAIAQRNAQFGAQFGAVGGTPVASNADAAAALASGPKSAPAPVHDAMGGNDLWNMKARTFSPGIEDTPANRSGFTSIEDHKASIRDSRERFQSQFKGG